MSQLLRSAKLLRPTASTVDSNRLIDTRQIFSVLKAVAY